MTLLTRFQLAWRLLWHSELPFVPTPPSPDTTKLDALLALPLSAAMADAVAKTEADPVLGTADHQTKFNETLQWCTHYARDRYHLPLDGVSSWQLAFLLEYHVGAYKGKL